MREKPIVADLEGVLVALAESKVLKTEVLKSVRSELPWLHITADQDTGKLRVAVSGAFASAPLGVFADAVVAASGMLLSVAVQADRAAQRFGEDRTEVQRQFSRLAAEAFQASKQLGVDDENRNNQCY